jgi:hypothetical protein
MDCERAQRAVSKFVSWWFPQFWLYLKVLNQFLMQQGCHSLLFKDYSSLDLCSCSLTNRCFGVLQLSHSKAKEQEILNLILSRAVYLRNLLPRFMRPIGAHNNNNFILTISLQSWYLKSGSVSLSFSFSIRVLSH